MEDSDIEEKSESLKRLRRMVRSALSERGAMLQSACFLAERLTRHVGASTEDFVTYANCLFATGECSRCIAVLESFGLLSAQVIEYLHCVVTSKSAESERRKREIHTELEANEFWDKLAAVNLACRCLCAMSQYEDCLSLMDPLIGNKLSLWDVILLISLHI